MQVHLTFAVLGCVVVCKSELHSDKEQQDNIEEIIAPTLNHKERSLTHLAANNYWKQNTAVIDDEADISTLEKTKVRLKRTNEPGEGSLVNAELQTNMELVFGSPSTIKESKVKMNSTQIVVDASILNNPELLANIENIFGINSTFEHKEPQKIQNSTEIKINDTLQGSLENGTGELTTNRRNNENDVRISEPTNLNALIFKHFGPEIVQNSVEDDNSDSDGSKASPSEAALNQNTGNNGLSSTQTSISMIIVYTITFVFLLV